MLRFGPLVLLAALTLRCASSPEEAALPAGVWEGSLSPMNHPEMVTPIQYEVGTEGGAPTIVLLGPGGTRSKVRDLEVTPDTVRFVFDEPEEGIPLRCALGRTATPGYEGRCTDAEGKYAIFRMIPPAS